MAGRIGALRATVRAIRGLRQRGARIDRSVISDNYQNTCRRCLSTVPSIYQKYISTDHEWVEVNEGIGTVGITQHAQDLLGDLVYVELPDVGDEVDKDDTVGVVESVKAASDVMTPVTGSIVAINEAVKTAPETVNKHPEDDGWLFQIQLNDTSELDDLMSEEQYKQFLAESEE